MQSNERLLGLKNSLESMTQSVRDTLVDTWRLEDEEDSEYTAESNESEIEKDPDSDGYKLNGNASEETVQCEQAGSDGSSLQSNNDEG